MLPLLPTHRLTSKGRHQRGKIEMKKEKLKKSATISGRPKSINPREISTSGHSEPKEVKFMSFVRK